jgi:homoserine kinase type II
MMPFKETAAMDAQDADFHELLSNYSEFCCSEYTLDTPKLGLNNTTRFVTAANDSYVLRIYDNHADLDAVLYEHELLQQLKKCSLHFATPSLMLTNDSLTYTQLSDNKIACLFKTIPGENKKWTGIELIEKVGQAVADLVSAMGFLKIKSPPPLPPYHRLYHRNRLVSQLQLDKLFTDPPFAIPKENSAIFRSEIELQVKKAAQYGNLRHQITHGDLFFGNMLFNRHCVSGILDFEFSTGDLRVMDTAIPLTHFILWKKTEDSAILTNMEAFLKGFGKRLKLDQAEIEIIPDLILLQTISLFTHFYNRYLAGNEDIQRVERHFNVFFTVKLWTDLHRQQLIFLCQKHLL